MLGHLRAQNPELFKIVVEIIFVFAIVIRNHLQAYR